MADKAIKARVHGRVQGVGFRYSTLRQAQRLDLQGYVRNMPDGTVEVVAEGTKDKVEILSKWLKKGPTGSYVSNLQINEAPVTGFYRTFTIEH